MIPDPNSPKQKTLWKETLRKTIHLSGLLIPVLYWYLPERIIVYILLLALFVAAVVEIFRFHSKSFHQFFNHSLGFLLRKEEFVSITGATYWIIGALTTILIYPKQIAIFAISMLIISDALAAWVGESFGKIKIKSNKTLEGSLAFFLSAFFIARVFLDFSSTLALLGAFVGSIFEWGILPLNDNLTVPIGGGLIVLLLQKIV